MPGKSTAIPSGTVDPADVGAGAVSANDAGELVSDIRHRRQHHRLRPLDGRAQLVVDRWQFGVDEQVDRPPAGKADGEGVVV